MLTVSEIIRVLRFEQSLRDYDIAQALGPCSRETAAEEVPDDFRKRSEPGETDGREDC